MLRDQQRGCRAARITIGNSDTTDD